MSPNRQDEPSVAEQAADWLHESESADPQSSAAFLEWLKASPEHVREFLIAGRLRQLTRTMDPDRLIDTDELMAKARAEIQAADESFRIRPPVVAAKRSDRWDTLIAAIAASVAILVAGWFIVPIIKQQMAGSTAASGQQDTKLEIAGNEQRNVRLEDQSTVSLHAKSRLLVRFTPQVRDVDLLDGQALFQVQHEQARPFRVHAASVVIQAIGTRFDVQLMSGGRTMILVAEGVVEVFARITAHSPEIENSGIEQLEPVRIAAGEGTLVASDGTIAQPRRIDDSIVSQWRSGQLVFSNMSVGEIADEFNRYNSTPHLRAEGNAGTVMMSSVVMYIHDPKSFADYLAKRGFSVERHANEILIRSPQVAVPGPPEE